ncbi:MAG: hypothetical protein ACRD15_18930, partial [Vicinamibacterales bacterium]
MKPQLVATLGGALVLTLLYSLTGIVLGPPPGPEAPLDVLPWLLLSNLLIAGVLAWLARASVWTGWRLAAALFAVAWGIGTFNGLVEAHFFSFFDRPGEMRAILLLLLVPALLFAPVMAWLSGRWRHPADVPALPPAHGSAGWIARFAACAIAYLVLYFTAGTIIYPYVQQFYDGRLMPSALALVLLQLCVRGPIFVALGLLIVRMAPAAKRRHAIMVGLAMSVLGGAAPLIVPNPYFPDAVRWVHFVETVTSNLAFGAIVGWLLGGT